MKTKISIYIAAFFVGLFVATIITGSISIGIPVGIVCVGIPVALLARKAEARKLELQSLWPEILDNLISGLHSGLALAETIANLGKRGPDRTKSIFTLFALRLRDGATFSSALEIIRESFNESTADQVCEVLDFARSSGGRDTALTLRTLSNFIRADIALRNEITAKHSWVKNSAALAAVAPWVLLLLLASQPNTVSAYSSGSGLTVLLAGAGLTLVAYFWMNKVGTLKTVPRVFK
ncbi:MAG: type II secretion system F family protein [Actinobacteria bacterium]|jgi:tight adherence protein B|nr:type II secretion system F family protein [Actinomycetota bacterium]